MKTCTKCHATKPPEDFHFIKRSESHDTRCRQCVNAYLRERIATLPHAREQQAASAKRWQAKNPEKRLWKNKTAKQRKAAYVAVRRWRAKNPERHRNESRASLQLSRSIGFRTAWPTIVAHYSNACLACGGAKPVFDHVVPLSSGGVNSLTNGQPLCRACNTRKGSAADSAQDYRPDKGAWIVELANAQPWILTLSVQRGRRSLVRKAREARAAQNLALPE